MERDHPSDRKAGGTQRVEPIRRRLPKQRRLDGGHRAAMPHPRGAAGRAGPAGGRGGFQRAPPGAGIGRLGALHPCGRPLRPVVAPRHAPLRARHLVPPAAGRGGFFPALRRSGGKARVPQAAAPAAVCGRRAAGGAGLFPAAGHRRPVRAVGYGPRADGLLGLRDDARPRPARPGSGLFRPGGRQEPVRTGHRPGLFRFPAHGVVRRPRGRLPLRRRGGRHGGLHPVRGDARAACGSAGKRPPADDTGAGGHPPPVVSATLLRHLGGAVSARGSR